MVLYLWVKKREKKLGLSCAKLRLNLLCLLKLNQIKYQMCFAGRINWYSIYFANVWLYIKVIFHFQLFGSSSVEVIFHRGFLPWRWSSLKVIFLLLKIFKIILSSPRVDRKMLENKFSSFSVIFSYVGHLPFRSSSIFSKFPNLFWALLE